MSRSQGPPDWLRYAAASLLLLVWIASMVTDMNSRSYDPPAYIHLALVIGGGGLFGWSEIRQIWRRNGDDK